CRVAELVAQDGCEQLVVEDVAGDALSSLVIEAIQVGNAAAQHDGRRVEDVDDVGEAAPERLEKAVNGGRGGLVGAAKARDGRQVQGLATARAVVGLDGRTAREGFEAAAAAAVTVGSAAVEDGVVAPFAGDAVQALPNPA